MGEEASSDLGPLITPPHEFWGLPRFGTTEGPATWAWGPRPFWDHPRPHGRGGSPCFGTTEPPPHGRWGLPALGPPRPPPHGRRGLLRFGTTGPAAHGRGGLIRFGTSEASATWARRAPPFWDHRAPRHMGAGRGIPPFWDHRGPYHMRGGASSLF